MGRWRPERKPMPWDEVSVEALGLSGRVTRALIAGGICTLGQLFDLDRTDLRCIRNVGRKAYDEICQRRQEFLASGAPAAAHTTVTAPRVPGPPAPAPETARRRTATSVHSLPPRNHTPTTDAPVAPESLEDLTGLLFSHISAMQKQAVMLRLGFDSGEPRTFAAVGQALGLSPTTVYQWVRNALNRLHIPRARTALEIVTHVCAGALAERGGAMTTAGLGALLAARFAPGPIDPTAFARFVLPLCSGICALEDDRWALAAHGPRLQQTEACIQQLLTAADHPLPIPDVIGNVLPQVPDADEPAIRTLLSAGGRFRTAADWCYLTAWERGALMRRWTMAALYQIGRPASYIEVTAVLRRHFPHLPAASPVAVHARLNQIDGVERIRQGTYALRRPGPARVQTAESLDDWLDLALGEFPRHWQTAINLCYGLQTGAPLPDDTVRQRAGLSQCGLVTIRTRVIESLAERPHLEPLRRYVRELIAAHGGKIAAPDLGALLAARYPARQVDPAAFARFLQLLCTGGKVRRWSLTLGIAEHLAVLGHPLPVDQLIAAVPGLAGTDPAALRQRLEQNRRLTLAGDWCLLRAWRRRLQAPWVLAALHSLGRPADARAVAAQVGRIAPHLRMTEPVVAMVLSGAAEVERIGRGTYGLLRWRLAAAEEAREQAAAGAAPGEGRS